MTAFQQDERSEERVITPPDEPCGESSETADSGLASAAARARALLTFRLDLEFRQRLRARLAGEGRSLSEVVIHGLQLYLQQAMSSREEQATPPREEEDASPAPTSAPVPAKSAGPAAMAVASVADLALPDEVTVQLCDLRRSGQSELLSATLAALHAAGWPLRPLAAALGISRQAVLARVRQRVPAEVRSLVPAVPPPALFPRRRSARPEGRRPHLTVKIDQALRAAAHRQAQREGSSLSQVVERILDHYLRHGLPVGEIRLGDTTPTRPAARRKHRSPAKPDPGD
jgi:predicted HicB family RNase H-like nuclease